MLRVLLGNGGKIANAMYVADEAMVRGMGVVKGAGKAEFPASATCANIFFVTKESIPTGIDTLKGDLSDYDTSFENINLGEAVVLVTPVKGEEYFTDQHDEVAVDDYLVVGTDGKFEKAGTSTLTNLKVKSITYKDAGTHAGIVIEVVDFITTAAS